MEATTSSGYDGHHIPWIQRPLHGAGTEAIACSMQSQRFEECRLLNILAWDEVTKGVKDEV
jgi:hypothetical protein